MGQDQSREAPTPSSPYVVDPDPSNQQGFGAGPRRQRKKSPSPLPTQPTDTLSAPPPAAKDSYFSLAQIGDVINPIFVSSTAKEAAPAGLPGTFDIAQAFRALLKKQSTDLAAASDSGRSDSSLSDSSGDEGEVGKYHREVERSEKEEDPTHASSHPIRVKGRAFVGMEVRTQDLSKWSNQFPVHKYEWFISSAVANSDFFEESSVMEGDKLLLPSTSLGRYVKVIASRKVEDLTKGPGFRAGGVDYVDPHAREGERDILPRMIREVKSSAVIGPIQMAEPWASAVVAILAGNNSSILKSNRRTLTVTDVKNLSKILTAADDGDEARLSSLIEKHTCSACLSFGKHLDQVTAEFPPGWLYDHLLGSKTDYLWFTSFREDREKKSSKEVYKIGLTEAHFGISNASATSFIPYLTILPAVSGSGGHTGRIRPIILCPVLDVDTIWTTPKQDLDMTFLFCLISCLRAARSPELYETKKIKFPKTGDDWARLLQDEEVQPAQDLLQRFFVVHTKDGTLGEQLVGVWH